MKVLRIAISVHVIAYLKFVLIEHPSWWKEADFGYELFDMNIIESIYEKAVELEDAWVKAAWGDKDDGKEG